MRRIVEVQEGIGGLESLHGETVILLCAAYFYTGKLTGINAQEVELTDASIVYETGAWSDKKYKDSQKFSRSTLYVRLSAIEAYGQSK